MFIDAFHALKNKTSDVRNAFILTHYHADHYTGLPRGKSYVGPAMIHCTPVTANLLREIHNIDPAFILEHGYGITWNHGGTEVTFYDANHCPGAAIVFVKIKLSVSSSSSSAGPLYTYHLHTGDMRFHEKFKSYPLIKQAVTNRQLDILYLDTTYAQPKHTFAPQDQAIQTIASQVKELLNPNHHVVHQKKQSFFQPKTGTAKQQPLERTLVLVACYSIGKEKVLWHSAVQSNQLVYVNKTKHKMLTCIQCCHDHDNDNENNVEVSSGIVQRCTLDKQQSDLHVIKMGMAGSVFPYFQANFEECASYAHGLNKGYSKVVAFIPTGWADSSKYNKENAISCKTVNLKEVVNGSKINGNSHLMEVEVRLVAYSEHSSYNELRDCVEYMKPKRIIPTVFSSEKDYIAIEKRFRDLVDGQRAKQSFIDSIGGSAGGKNRKAAVVSPKGQDAQVKHAECNVNDNEVAKEKCEEVEIGTGGNEFRKRKSNNLSPSEGVVSKIRRKGDSQKGQHPPAASIFKADDAKVAQLVNMGFSAVAASEGLIVKKNDLERAIEWLLSR